MCIFRSTLPQSRPNKAGLKCPSVHTDVHTYAWTDRHFETGFIRPSTKSFFDFNEIWHVGRGRRVMHDGMQYDPVKVTVTRPSIWKSGYFQKRSPPPFTMGAGN